MSESVRLRVAGNAARFLTVLEDYGYIAPDAADRLILGVSEVPGLDQDGRVRVADVRRTAAVWLFATGEGSADAVGQDWLMFFS